MGGRQESPRGRCRCLHLANNKPAWMTEGSAPVAASWVLRKACSDALEHVIMLYV